MSYWDRKLTGCPIRCFFLYRSPPPPSSERQAGSRPTSHQLLCRQTVETVSFFVVVFILKTMKLGFLVTAASCLRFRLQFLQFLHFLCRQGTEVRLSPISNIEPTAMSVPWTASLGPPPLDRLPLSTCPRILAYLNFTPSSIIKNS